jgi:hypothetical protein
VVDGDSGGSGGSATAAAATGAGASKWTKRATTNTPEAWALTVVR